MKSLLTPEKLNEFVRSLERNNIKYIVIAGFGIDGKRGYETRPHQDLDVLCLKEDLMHIKKVIHRLGYKTDRYNDLIKLNREDGAKIDLGLVTIENEEAVTYGRIAVTRFPKELFYKPQRGNIGRIEFKIAPNELLKTWGADSQKGNDSDYAKRLPVDENIMERIKRVKR